MHPAEMTAAEVAPTVAAATDVTTATVAAATMATTAARQGGGRETQHAKGDAHQKNSCCLGHRDFSCDAASGRAHAPVRLKNLGVWSNRFSSDCRAWPGHAQISQDTRQCGPVV
jgi:hypothetical protein